MKKEMLNLEFYSGKDFYCDGEIEDELLEIVSNHEDYSEILKSDNRWPILYHLSDIRENLLDWYEFGKESSVLEIGAGCGAVTGVLCRKAGQVTCIELSKKRSMINAVRNKDYDNLEIMVGNFEDIQIDKKFDYVTLIGVLEYASSYINDSNPFSAMLERIKSFLKPDGKIVIAIENKFGLKYFAGATEDHTGNWFDGIEEYKKVKGVKTFSKPEMERLLQENQYRDIEFYYPMPDYKMPTMVYSEGYLPKRGELRNITAVYDRERYELFDEEAVYDQFCDDGMFGYFANSFLIFAQTN